ncbi:MAG TPA: helicase-related protein [Polyangiaceae bacterium]|nr:helicase-related protein [Polyangiaceae bacterium]
MSSELPVLAIRAEFTLAQQRGPVVLTSPTGSGKSTEVPRWCAGKVLVIEPRRLACRSLATRVAELEGSRLGEAVGYVVRDEHVAGSRTRIVFATPGMVLRNRALLDGVGSVILDEFHERSLELDLLLALLLAQRSTGLVILSATLDGERVCRHVGGVHLHAPGRAFPVEVRYLPGHGSLPDAAELPSRVAQAVSAAAADAGDILVFLPGKAEIEDCANALRGSFSVVPLHGGLTLPEQQRAFEPTPRRKLILATNVAETSLTVPGVGVVIDAGLVRQTLYQAGRASLTLTPIAEDSAAQRTGRAGRTAPGVCYRLWSAGASLAPTPLPEIHRGSLVPLVLTAAAWGVRVESLPLLDPPKPYALEAARVDLRAWGALAGDSALSACGQQLFALPIDAQHARLLVEARRHGCLDDMIDLVAVLSVGRPLFDAPAAAPSQLGIAEDLRRAGCDASAAIRALRAQRPADHGASVAVVQEARSARARLRRAEGLPELPAIAPERPLEHDALVAAALAADARLAHVARVRGRDVYFGNGGTELELSRESAAHHVREIEAILALDTRAFGAGRNARVLVTCALPVPLAALARAGLGSERIAAVRVENRRIVCTLERVYANRVLATREAAPQGELAQSALLELLLRGSVFRDAVALTRQRLVHLAIAAWLGARAQPSAAQVPAPLPTLEAWLRARVVSLGVQSGEDLALLSEGDFLAPEVPYELRASIENDYPLTVSAGDATYRAEYDLSLSQVTLQQTKGSRRDAPALGYLPRFPGLRIIVEGPRGLTVVRARG